MKTIILILFCFFTFCTFIHGQENKNTGSIKLWTMYLQGKETNKICNITNIKTFDGLITNITEYFPQHFESYSPELTSEEMKGVFCYAVYYCKLVNDDNPTHKTVITEIYHIHTIEFDWYGQSQKLGHKSLITRTEETFSLEKSWKKD